MHLYIQITLFSFSHDKLRVIVTILQFTVPLSGSMWYLWAMRCILVNYQNYQNLVQWLVWRNCQYPNVFQCLKDREMWGCQTSPAATVAMVCWLLEATITWVLADRLPTPSLPCGHDKIGFARPRSHCRLLALWRSGGHGPCYTISPLNRISTTLWFPHKLPFGCHLVLDRQSDWLLQTPLLILYLLKTWVILRF